VLDRLVRLGQGISAAQRNDFAWFKDAWDSKMFEEHAGAWPALFATWAQQVLQQHEAGNRSAFSVFLHNETQRCFGNELALVLP
jgi:hypothetical protein